jgi:hypothetical protein
MVANRHEGLSALLRNTPYENAFANHLQRWPGAFKADQQYFAGKNSRAWGIPMSLIINIQ